MHLPDTETAHALAESQAAHTRALMAGYPVAERLKWEARELELLAIDPPVELLAGATEDEVDWKVWRAKHRSLRHQASRLQAKAQPRTRTRSRARTARRPARQSTRRPRSSSGTSSSSSSGDGDGGSGDSDPPPSDRLWSIKDLATYLQLSPRTLYNRHSEQRWDLLPAPSLYLGDRPRWRPEDVHRWVAERVRLSTDPPPDDQSPGRRGGGSCSRS